MTGSSVAGIITAVSTVLIATGGLVTAFGLLLPVLRQTKEIHKIVNQQRTDAMNYQRALIKALRAHGIDVPDDQSRPPDTNTSIDKGRYNP